MVFSDFSQATHRSAAILTFSLLLATGSSQATLTAAGNETIKQTSIEIVNQLRLHHYRYLSIDNDFSSMLMDKYIERLDPSKSYFTQADISSFEPHRYYLDNALNKGDLEPALAIFNNYLEKVESRLNWIILQLENNNPALFDFTAQDSIEINREEAPWAIEADELDALWLKRVKHAALNLKMADKHLKRFKKFCSNVTAINCTDKNKQTCRTHSRFI